MGASLARSATTATTDFGSDLGIVANAADNIGESVACAGNGLGAGAHARVNLPGAAH